MEKNKSLLYIHESCPHPNKLGSDLVIYRHLKRAEENAYKIYMILPQSSFPAENRLALPDTWKIYLVPNPYGFIKPWMVNRFRWFIYSYYFLMSFNIIRESESQIILSYFWGYNFSGYARFAARMTGKRLVYFFHDRFYHFFPAEITARLKKFEENNANQASKILTVSAKLIFNQATAFKHEVLLPIPKGDVIEGKNVNGSVWLYSGAVYPSQYHFFLSLAEVLKEYNASLTIITNFTKEEELVYKKHCNIKLVRRFVTNHEALNYIGENASVIVTGYPEDITVMPWIEDCFPSKFLEYCFFNIPVIAFSPLNTAFYNWCMDNSFQNIFSEYSRNTIVNIIKSMADPAHFKDCLNNQKMVREKHFLPDTIQKAFEKYL